MILAIDCETSRKPSHLPWMPGSYLTSIAVVSDCGVSGCFLFKHNESNGLGERQQVEELQLMINKATVIIAHNMKFDLHWLRWIGLNLEDTPIYCTMVAEYLIRGQQCGALSLDNLASHYGLSCKDDIDWDIPTHEQPLQQLMAYNIQDANLALSIALKQRTLIIEAGMGRLVRQQNEQIHCLTDIESTGLRVNKEVRDGLESDYRSKLRSCEEDIKRIAGSEFNIGSGTQLSCALFGGSFSYTGREQYSIILKSGESRRRERNAQFTTTLAGMGFIPDPSTTLAKPGYWSTAVPILQGLYPQAKRGTPHRKILDLLITRSALSQVISTYLDGINKHIVNGVVHPSMNQTITATGRLSCSRPNLQNQPDDVKGMFLPVDL